ncbi:PD-(D/E)XK nuclease family protein [Odoribacter lunatus]|uniref:PD-(D/E)XK nuclease family protein n=1 Tax=Odoribacter lunatus TaxID=2941335 RepID=UPI00203F3A67|nr:PD-(D/E)XK nuclease family protein [Odoribacter lunatus]
MSSFLHLLAADLIKKYPNFEDTTVIFPNKRAGLFLADEISNLINHPVWMPKIITLPDFIREQTGLRKADDLVLTIKLYKAYREINGNQETFEDFYFWGNMLLGDFDDIDKYLVDAKALFSNLTALKNIEYNIPYLTPEQIEAIKKFWSTFNPQKYSKEQQEFLKIWDQLYTLYTSFKNSLIQEKIAYEGMSLRHYLENIQSSTHTGTIIFAGFNALNLCEKQIFSHFQNTGQALFYWDYDLYYTANEYHEAGKYIRENLKLFPNELGKEHFNNFKHNRKNIEFISVPSTIGQAKLIPELIKDVTPRDYIQTAVVLCDERMLLPVMHSIPDDIRKINITMGYPAHNTSVASLIFLLGELQKYMKNGSYYYKPVIAILNHKLVKESAPEEVDKITDDINRKNIVYISGKQLHFNEITQEIFSREKQKPIDYILRILQLIFRLSDEKGTQLHSVEKEFIFNLITQLQSLQNTFSEEGIEPEDKLYLQIINKVIHAITIPFSGEPLEGLQLMGLMETRMLDFKKLIILSANEGIIPKTSTVPSFIPYNLRVGFRLPTPEHQDILFAYYFYRLLQRAENIHILYTTASKNINSGEMSRYMYQIKYESGLPVKEINFQNHISVSNTPAITVEKNTRINAWLETVGDTDTHPLSPSALNTYIDCPLKFYFKYTAGIKEQEEIAEELDHRLLGNIFHECAESLYATVAQETITPEIIDRFLNSQSLIDEHIQRSYLNFYDREVSQLLDSGSNELILPIIRKYLLQMFRYDRKICPFRIISMEKKYVFPLQIDLNGITRTIHIGGIIDRIDETKNAIRIIDYKTGSDTTTFKNIESLFDGGNTTRNKAAFQTLLYCLMFGHTDNRSKPLQPGIYSTKLLFAPDYNHLLKHDQEFIINFDRYKDEFAPLLKQLLEKLYSPDVPFTQALDEKKCRTCPYAAICGK